MAKLTAPLLSLSASGKFADTLVAFSWKGINVMRQWVKPANPQTADQVAQRDAMTACVAAWRYYFTGAAIRTGWGRLALQLADTMSGFNAFIRNAVKNYNVAAENAMGNGFTALAGQTCKVKMDKLSDGTAATEAGNFQLWYGSKPDSLLQGDSAAIAEGYVTFVTDMGATGDDVYVKVVKDGLDRSGIEKITLLA